MNPNDETSKGITSSDTILSMIVVYTDGSSRGNPGKGGYGVLIVTNYSESMSKEEKNNSKVIELGGREENTTNNRMELSAVREAFSYILSREIVGDLTLYTDSSYVRDGLDGWVYGWEKNGWKTKTGEEVQNQDLWKDLAGMLFRLKKSRKVDLVKVSGHHGVVANEHVDNIATSFADGEQVLLFTGSLSHYEELIGGEITLTTQTNGKKKTSKKSSTEKAYSYVSLVSGNIYVDKTWADCEKRVKGKKGVKYKKVFSKEEETSLIKEFENK